MRILLVEDNEKNIAAAEAQITDHELIIARTHDEAREILDQVDYRKVDSFDVVLTDVMMPKGSGRCMNDEGNALVRRQGEMPYGPVLALRALGMGIKKVGVVTAGNHHADPFVYAFDAFSNFTAGDVKVVCTNNSYRSDGAKDWEQVLKDLLAEPKEEKGD